MFAEWVIFYYNKNPTHIQVYFKNSRLLAELQGFCIDDDDCKLMENARCSSENKCICKINYGEINEESCAPLLGESCTHDNQCVVAKSICFENKCQCDSKNSQRLNEQCFHRKYNGKLSTKTVKIETKQIIKNF